MKNKERRTKKKNEKKVGTGTHFLTCGSGKAPTNWFTTFPSLNARTVGRERTWVTKEGRSVQDSNIAIYRARYIYIYMPLYPTYRAIEIPKYVCVYIYKGNERYSD